MSTEYHVGQMSSPGFATTRPVRVYIRYRRRWLKMTLPAGQSFNVAGGFWESFISPLFTVRCMLWHSDIIYEHVISLGLPCNDLIHDVYIPIRDLRASCAPLQEPAKDLGARPMQPAHGLPASLVPSPLTAIPPGRRVTSPDGSRIAGWYCASTREDRTDETRIWHIAVFDAESHRLIQWWPHSVHERKDTGEQNGSPISSVTFDPSAPGTLVVACEDGTTQRIELTES